MSPEPVISGEIPEGGVLDILRDIEQRRITGRLRFTSRTGGSTQTGEVELLGGQLAMNQDALPDGTDPVEAFLALRAGHFVVHQRLPTLAVSHGDERVRTGSLEVHAPADLMSYCEQAGLTGVLTFARSGESASLHYEGGDLLSIQIGGRETGDLSPIFSWPDGTFRIEVEAHLAVAATGTDADERYVRDPTTQFVRSRTAPPLDTGRFLKVVEVALSDLAQQRDRGRPPTGLSRIAVPVRPRQPTLPPPPRRPREPTVRVVYLNPDDPRTAYVQNTTPPASTRHAARGAREEALPEAQASRRAEPASALEAVPPPRLDPSLTAPTITREPSIQQRDSSVPRQSQPRVKRPDPIGPVLWAIALVAVGVFVMMALSRLG